MAAEFTLARRWELLATIAALIGLWELVGQYDLVARGALPGPSEILIRFWADRADYPAHIAATLTGSALGFLFGNVIAILAGTLFAVSPVALRLSRGINIAIFALPPIAIAPILVLTLSGIAPRVVLAAMGCYFVTMTATVVGLTQFDQRAADVVRAYGGGRWQFMRLVQWRGALPAILGGLRVAAPNAVLGSILAEFGGGGRFGLGAYLLGSLGRADPARLWGIGLTATAIAGLAYFLFAITANKLLGSSRSVTLNAASAPPSPMVVPLWQRAALMTGAALLPFIGWWAFVRALNVPDLIAKTPLAVFDYLLFSNAAASAQTRLLEALGETLPLTIVGMAAGLSTAFALAISRRLFPRTVEIFVPIAMVTQTMPLVALTPLLVLLLGRGPSLIMWVTVSVTFFPAFVTIAQGLDLVPRGALELPRAYGASAWTEIRIVAIPAALPHLFAAARLTAPRALLGVMIAEWLATGTGLGNLLNHARGTLDFGMIWTVAAVSVLISAGFYQIVVAIEQRVLKRFGTKTTE